MRHQTTSISTFFFIFLLTNGQYRPECAADSNISSKLDIISSGIANIPKKNESIPMSQRSAICLGPSCDLHVFLIDDDNIWIMERIMDNHKRVYNSNKDVIIEFKGFCFINEIGHTYLIVETEELKSDIYIDRDFKDGYSDLLDDMRTVAKAVEMEHVMNRTITTFSDKNLFRSAKDNKLKFMPYYDTIMNYADLEEFREKFADPLIYDSNQVNDKASDIIVLGSIFAFLVNKELKQQKHDKCLKILSNFEEYNEQCLMSRINAISADKAKALKNKNIDLVTIMNLIIIMQNPKSDQRISIRRVLSYIDNRGLNTTDEENEFKSQLSDSTNYSEVGEDEMAAKLNERNMFKTPQYYTRYEKGYQSSAKSYNTSYSNYKSKPFESIIGKKELKRLKQSLAELHDHVNDNKMQSQISKYKGYDQDYDVSVFELGEPDANLRYDHVKGTTGNIKHN